MQPLTRREHGERADRDRQRGTRSCGRGAPDLADLVDAPPAVAGDRPRVVAAAAAQGVAASVVDQAAAALAAATGASTGLYRSCWPAGGDFGAGIRPTGLSRPEPGLTLRLRVEAKR